MKKLLLFAILPLAIFFVGWHLNEIRQINEDAGRYGIGEQTNKAKTGSAVCFNLNYGDDWYLFVRDFKRNPTHPQLLCYMNYTSTQGSYQAKWSKDAQMIGVYDKSSDHFPELKWPKWVTGYDWQQGRVLHSEEIAQQFKNHGGIDTDFIFPELRKPTPQELKQFQPETLNRDKQRP